MASLLYDERTIQRSAWERTRRKNCVYPSEEKETSSPFRYIILHIVRIPMVFDSLKKKKKKTKKMYAIELELSLKREIFFVWPGRDPSLFLSLSLSFCAMGRGVCQAERHVWRCNKNSRCVWLHRTRYINPPPPGGVFRGETCCVRCRIKT